LVALVVPAAEAFFDFFDEAGEVAEAVFEAVEFRLDGGFVAEAAPFGEFGLELVDVGLAVEGAEVGEEALFAVGAVEAGDPGGAMGDGGEEVEVVAHDAEGEEVDAGEVSEAVEDAAEGFFFGGVEEEVAAAGAGHDVVEVGGEGGGAEDAFTAAGPGTRRGEEGGFGVDGEEWVRGGRVGGKGAGWGFHGGRVAGVGGEARKMPGIVFGYGIGCTSK
jgi:hypothetical protein